MTPTPWIPRSLTASVAVICVALAPGTVGCTPEPGHDAPDREVRLTYPGGDNAARVTTLDTVRDRPHSYGAVHVCTSATGSVVIEAIELSGGKGGLTLTRFATKPARASDEPIREGAARGPLEALGFDATQPVKVTTTCYKGDRADNYDASQHLTELAIELKRTTPSSGSYDKLNVLYSDNGQKRTLVIPFGITLCARGDQSTPHCNHQ